MMERGQGHRPNGRERNGLPLSVMHFSLDDIDPRDRLPQWQELLCTSITGCRTTISDWAKEFRADFDLVAGEQISIAHSRTYGIGTARDRDCIRDGDDHLVLFLKLDGTTQMTMQDSRFLLTPGDAVLVDFAVPFDMQAAGTNCDLLVLRLPRHMAGSGAGRDGVGIVHRSGSPMVRLLRSYAAELFAMGAEGAAIQRIAERHLVELVSALRAEPSDIGATGPGALDEARIAAIREQIAAHFRDPCLNMRKVAARLGFSERLGQLILSRRGLSFSDLLQRYRLDRAHERLVYPNERVMDVAFDVGFSDLSHFHRLYKARFGYTPAETHEVYREGRV